MNGLSIILPCYNKEKTIESSIITLENQTLVKNKRINVEIICIDDCSSDNTYKILTKLRNKYNNIQIYSNDVNSSVFATRIKGINMATQPYIAFMDPDDHADETFYEELYAAAISSGADIVQTPSVIKDYGYKKYEPAITWFSNMRDGEYEVSEKTFDKIVRGNWTTLWNRIFKRDKISKIAAYPPYYINFLEDMLIYLSTVVISKKVCNVKTKGYYYYNLSNEVEHLSKPTDRLKGRAMPTSKVFQLLNSFLVESNNMKYYDNIVRFRNQYIRLYSAEYSKSFNITTECFTNPYNQITIQDRYNEITKIRNTYVELLKSLF